MALDDAQLAILKTELDTDSKGLGYTTDDPACATLLNQVGLAVPPETVTSDVVDGQELQKCVVISEYLALSDVARDGWLAIISAGTGQVDPADARTVAQIQAIWNGTTTLTGLAALATRPCSRAETLFGAGITIRHQDVGLARQVI